MTQRFKFIEKIIAVMLVILGVLTFYIVASGLNTLIEGGIQRKIIKPGEVPLFRLLMHFNVTILLSFAYIISGILLFFNKKSGWIIAMIALFSDALLSTMRIVFFDRKEANQFETNSDEKTFVMLWLLFFTTLIVILLLKPFRIKYSPTLNTYLLIIGITGVLLVDQTFT